MSSPLRVLQVSSSDLGGGAEGSAWNLFQAYKKRNIPSWLAVGRKKTNDSDVVEIPNEVSRSWWTRVCRDNSVEGTVGKVVRRIAWAGEPRRLWERSQGIEDFNYPGTWKLLDLPPVRPTIVHCHNLHGSFFDLRSLPSISRQVPVIVNLRDDWHITGHCAYARTCDRWKQGCGSCPDLNVYPPVAKDSTAYNWRRKREIYTASRLYVTAPSRWQLERAREAIPTALDYQVIPNGISLDHFYPGDQTQARALLNLSPDTWILLIVGHSEFRDMSTIEKALSRITETGGREVVAICVGKSGQDRQLNRVRFQYWGRESDPSRLLALYQASDLYLHAAYAESFGKTIVEAMAAGVPVVATATGGIPEIIEDGVTGILTPEADDVAMAHAIETLLLDTPLREQMRRAGIYAAKGRFDLNRQVSDFVNWYTHILEQFSHVNNVA